MVDKEQWIREMKWGINTRLGKAVVNCDPIAIRYALDVQHLLDSGFHKGTITANEFNELKDNLETTADTFRKNCKFIKK